MIKFYIDVKPIDYFEELIRRKITSDKIVDSINIIHRKFIAININSVIFVGMRHKDFFSNCAHNLP